MSIAEPSETGRQWRVWCPFCKSFHFHSPEPGHRSAHCVPPSPLRDTGYILKLHPDSQYPDTRPPARSPEKQAAVFGAYASIAQKTRVRFQRFSSGVDFVPIPADRIKNPRALTRELDRNVENFLIEENNLRYWLGCADMRDMKSFITLIEACRMLSGGEPDLALQLLRMAIRDIKPRT